MQNNKQQQHSFHDPYSMTIHSSLTIKLITRPFTDCHHCQFNSVEFQYNQAIIT